MANYDPRIVRVGVQIGNRLNWYSELAITADGSKTTSAEQGECTVSIANLSKNVRDYLLQETSPFNKNPEKKKLIIEAGRVSTGARRIFEGDITQTSITQPPDTKLTIKALAGNAEKGNIVSNTQPANTQLSIVAQRVAQDLSKSLRFEATDKNIKSFSFTGSALKQVGKLAEAGQVNAYVDGDFLIIKNQNKPLAGMRRILNKDNGMIGVPENTERGIKVTYLLDVSTELGTDLRIESELNPSVSGSYTVYKLSFQITNRDVPFYWIAEATRNG